MLSLQVGGLSSHSFKIIQFFEELKNFIPIFPEIFTVVKICYLTHLLEEKTFETVRIARK